MQVNVVSNWPSHVGFSAKIELTNYCCSQSGGGGEPVRHGGSDCWTCGSFAHNSHSCQQRLTIKCKLPVCGGERNSNHLAKDCAKSKAAYFSRGCPYCLASNHTMVDAPKHCKPEQRIHFAFLERKNQAAFFGGGGQSSKVSLLIHYHYMSNTCTCEAFIFTSLIGPTIVHKECAVVLFYNAAGNSWFICVAKDYVLCYYELSSIPSIF